MGAALVAALLAQTGFALAADLFRGVKAAHLAPPALFLLWWWLAGEGAARRMEAAAVEPVGMGGLGRRHGAGGRLLKAALALVALAAVAYVLRTGNHSGLVTDWERLARGWLEDVFGVRPRTKEFLIGYPALWLGLALFGARWRMAGPLLLAVGSVAYISLINTFAHAHSPLAISLARSAWGLALGSAVGLALWATWKLATERPVGGRSFWVSFRREGIDQRVLRGGERRGRGGLGRLAPAFGRRRRGPAPAGGLVGRS